MIDGAAGSRGGDSTASAHTAGIPPLLQAIERSRELVTREGKPELQAALN